MGNNASAPKDGNGSASPGGRPALHHHHSHHASKAQPQPSQQYQQHGHAPQSAQSGTPAHPSTTQPLTQQTARTLNPDARMAQPPPDTRAIPSRPFPTAADAVAASASPARNIPGAAARHASDMASAQHVEQAASRHGHSDYDAPLSPYADSMDTPMLGHNSVQDVSYMTRPPRLPLPIEEEVHTPGSPIVAAAPGAEPVDNLANLEELDRDGGDGGDGGGGGVNRSSTVSSVQADDDESELRVDTTRPTVPTRLEWLRGGDKVYVTGTIFQWNRKQRMHPVEGRPGVFATTINVLPGTHHIRFLVDNQMETSRDLPTTVDFGNNLVNYIEVAPQSAQPAQGALPSALGAPVVAPGSAGTAGTVTGGGQPGTAAAPAAKALSDAATAQRSDKSSGRPDDAPKLLGADSSVSLTNRAPKWKDVPDASAFSKKMPQYLVDYDKPDESPDFHSAAAATEILSLPPSLPGFLGKPILNAATLIKDDNSVLNMPNYTILNHLATSSIKNNILAVSVTTRYKSKFVTSIIYKPTGGQDGH